MRAPGNAESALMAILALLPAAASAEGPEVSKVCAQTACRAGGYDVALFTDATHFTSIQVTHSPYILDDGSVLIFPGETIAVQFAPNGDSLGKPISAKAYAPHLPTAIFDGQNPPVDNPADATLPVVAGKMPTDELAQLPPNTLLISYGPMKKIGNPGMMLLVEQNTDRTIKLDAIVAELNGKSYHQHYTSTCPLMPKLAGNEMWPNPLGPLVLRNIRFVATSQGFSCQ